MPLIQKVQAREILDSRGIPTIETTLELDNGIVVSASVPSGTSTGKHEAVESRWRHVENDGKRGVKAVRNVNEIIGPAVVGQDPSRQTALDQLLVNLDGTPNKAKLVQTQFCRLIGWHVREPQWWGDAVVSILQRKVSTYFCLSHANSRV
jgi:enolase